MSFFAGKKKKQVHSLIMEHIKDVEECLINFECFMCAATTPQTVRETLRPLSVAVQQAEAVADLSLRRKIDSLSSAAYRPSTRRNLISIGTSCDSVANKCEAIAKKIVSQNFRFPECYNGDIMEIMRITRKQYSLLEESVSALFSDFSKLVKDHTILDRIRKMESAVDAIEEKLYEQVSSMDLGLAEKMQLHEFIELISDISDVIEDIADQVQILLITRKA